MFGSRPAALHAALDTATMVLPAWPPGVPADTRPAGTMAQLAGQGAWLVATPKRRVFPGRPDQVAQARRFVGRMLDGCPVADDAQLCASELASNAIRHTRTGRRSGKFQVMVWRGRASVCVAVLDEGSDGTAPAAVSAGMLAESGHGLLTVQTLAAWWGHHRYRDGSARGTAVWFRLDWNPVRSP
jgi:anti-sigma regulatory factor (Ser/Thr protein kinase)